MAPGHQKWDVQPGLVEGGYEWSSVVIISSAGYPELAFPQLPLRKS